MAVADEELVLAYGASSGRAFITIGSKSVRTGKASPVVGKVSLIAHVASKSVFALDAVDVDVKRAVLANAVFFVEAVNAALVVEDEPSEEKSRDIEDQRDDENSDQVAEACLGFEGCTSFQVHMHVQVELVDEDLRCHLNAAENNDDFDELVQNFAFLDDLIVVEDDETKGQCVEEKLLGLCYL